MVESATELSALFLKYDYAETKDFAKAFLTLASATLVFSLTFAEKVVDLKAGLSRAKLVIVGSWSAFIFAITCAGLAICFLALSAGEAVYGGNFEHTAARAYYLLLAAGVLYVAGLAGLIVTAVLSMNFRPR